MFFARRLHSADGATAMDTWDGYVANRNRLQQGWTARGVRGAVVLTGDAHRAYASDLMLDYDNPRQVIGTELVCSSVTSDGDGNADDTGGLSPLNPHIRFFSNLRGYTRVTVEPAQLTAEFRAVDRVTVRDRPVRTLKRYVVEAGNPGLHDAGP